MGRLNLRNSRLVLRVLPVLVWCGAVLCVIALFQRRTARFEFVGLARPEVRQVAATCDARLISVPVQLFDKVKAGDTVAVLSIELDDEHIDTAMATIQAQMDLIEAQLTELRDNYEAEIFNRQSEWWAEMRAFTADIVIADARIVGANATLETDKATLKDMEKEILRFKSENQAKLAAADVPTRNKLQTMKTNHDSLERKIIRDQEVLDKYEKLLEEAKERKEKYKSYLPTAGTTDEDDKRVIELAKKALERQKDELKIRREKLVLKAPCDGYVSDIQGSIGEAIMQGVEILRIAEEKPRAIIAYASEAVVGQLKMGKTVEIVKDSKPEQIAHSKITYIGPAVEQMPMRLWRNPNFPQWGRPMWIEVPIGMELIPGEMVGVRGL